MKTISIIKVIMMMRRVTHTGIWAARRFCQTVRCDGFPGREVREVFCFLFFIAKKEDSFKSNRLNGIEEKIRVQQTQS